MTGPPSGVARRVDLHDPGTLIAADAAALLPAAALAGAQVRSTADQLASLPEYDRPRALVVVGATAAVDVALLTALLGNNAQAPVVAASGLPGWVGPLDIVVVLATSTDDLPAAEAAAQAQRRGAQVLVRASADGPVGAAAGAALLEPPIAVPEALAAVARLTLLTSAAAAAGWCPRPDFHAAADQLDALAVACHPSSEFFVNPALTLADHLSIGTPLLIGTDQVADALAGHGSRSLAALAGCAASTLVSGQAAGSPAVLAAAAGGGAGGVFYDPYDDAGRPGQELSPVLIVGPSGQGGPGPLAGSSLLTPEAILAYGAGHRSARSPLATALETALPRALVIGPEELPAPAPQDPDAPVDGLRGQDAFSWTVAMACRLDFAAVYLGLLGGSRPPLDSPDGLGRPGQAAAHRPMARGRSATTSVAPAAPAPFETGEGRPSPWN